jgi:hypothetical protein
MKEKIELFVFVLSVIYCIKFIIEFAIILGQDDPAPLKISVIEKVFLYLASSFVITGIVSMIFLK